jgi:hypothetical protein
MSAIETMNVLLGSSNYQVVSNGIADPVVLARLPGEDRINQDALKNATTINGNVNESTASQQSENTNHLEKEKTMDDYVFQFYLGSLTVVGLFVLFRMIQKSK